MGDPLVEKPTRNFSYRSLGLKRVLPLTIIGLVMGFGVYFYARHQESINNFRPYYYQAYLASIKYRLSHPVEPAVPTLTTTSVPVLVYHGLIPGQSQGQDTSVESFTKQMLALKNAGYHTISIEQYYKFIYNGEALPQKSFLLTFDDGRKDSYYASEPVLEALNFRATMFVITGKSLEGLSSVYYLSENEIKAMVKSGHWDMQAHTRNGHDEYPIDETNKAPFFANKLWLKDQKRYETNDEYRDRVRADLVGAKADIQRELGTTPIAFAVPFGDIGQNQSNYSDAKTVLLSELKSAYPLTFLQATGGQPFSQNYIGSKLPINMRIEPKPDWDSIRLLSAITSSDARSLPYKSTLQTAEGWRTPWGNAFSTPGELTLQAGASTTGASTTLDGTGDWSDYAVSTTAHIPKGSSFRILLRQTDGDSYMACSFTPTGISVQQTRNGTSVTLNRVAVSTNFTASNVYTAIVKGHTVACGTGGKSTVAAITDPGLQRAGGLGFVVYDDSTNNAEGVITKVEVAVAE
jgi:peptidoglycan/xylan/chitin deacetylase (PgdA/CDA1 family)